MKLKPTIYTAIIFSLFNIETLAATNITGIKEYHNQTNVTTTIAKPLKKSVVANISGGSFSQSNVKIVIERVLGKDIKQLDIEIANAYKQGGNRAIRVSYNDKITKIYDNYFKTRFIRIHKNNKSIDYELACLASDIRGYLKKMHQKHTSYLGRSAITLHNLYNYGSTSNPTCGYFIEKGKASESIAYASLTTDGKDLGLKGNALRATVKQWRYLVKLGVKNSIYPEDILSVVYPQCIVGKGSVAFILTPLVREIGKKNLSIFCNKYYPSKSLNRN